MKDETDLNKYMDLKFGRQLEDLEPIYEMRDNVILYWGVKKKK